MTCVFCRACGVEKSLLPPNFKCANKKLLRLHYGQPVGNLYIGVTSPQRIACSSTKNTSLPVSPVNTMWIACSIGSPLTTCLRPSTAKSNSKAGVEARRLLLSECLNPHWLDLSRGWYSQMKDGGASRDASTPSARPQAVYLRSAWHLAEKNTPNPASLCTLRTSPRHSVRSRRIPTPASNFLPAGFVAVFPPPSTE